MTNRLAGERSAYLRTAKDQPVHWHAWGENAFDRAQREDKPILLDIGAVWCHWCHVMDHESYEDASLAQLLNERFVAVKVDRDERPDVDARYQKAIQAMTGQGGWPLTAFLLPDGRCFYGGTYFPPVDAHGRPSFRGVLEAVAEAYRERKDEILGNAKTLDEHLAGRARPVSEFAQDQWEDVLAHAVGHIRESFDPEHGGFGGAPKFPHAAAQDFLLARSARPRRVEDASGPQQGFGGDLAAKDVVVYTLERMQAGGVYDQLAGGFHRYSVDAKWIVPHFEKMLYDNAGLLRNYVRAARLTGRDDFRETAMEIKAFLRDALQQPEGGFGGSQDADVSSHDDGDHFTWTLDELREAVRDPLLAKLMSAYYGVLPAGDMHHDPAKCVLRIEAPVEALAAAFHLAPADVRARIAEGERRMREARARRPVPFIDPTRYASWNGMATAALLELGGAFADEEADAMALRALDAFLATAYDPAKGFARSPGSAAFGFLDDNAQMLDALVEAHFATGNPSYLSAARDVGDLLLGEFAHPDGGFVDRAPRLAPRAEAAPLANAERPIQDAPTASPNGVALRALLRLSETTGDAKFADAARASLRKLAGEAARLSLFGGALLLAMHEATHPRPRIVVAGDVERYRAAARKAAPPGSTLAAQTDVGVPDEARLFAGEGAMVCLGTRCLAPARSSDELVERLRGAG